MEVPGDSRATIAHQEEAKDIAWHHLVSYNNLAALLLMASKRAVFASKAARRNQLSWIARS